MSAALPEKMRFAMPCGTFSAGDFFSVTSRWRPTILEVGAGRCEFINNIVAARKIAVDLSTDTPRFAAPGVEVMTAPSTRLGNLAWAYPGFVDRLLVGPGETV